jgi:probable HAF family extracellular repeat protein
VRFTGTDTASQLIMSPVAGYKNAVVSDTSETGVSIGRSYKTGAIVATSWTAGKPTNLGQGIANAISPNGKVIVGAIAVTSGILTSSHAYVFKGGVKDLGALGGRSSSALDVNDSGYVVGTAEDDTGKAVAFLYNGKTMIDIAPSYEIGQANAISNSGLIVGKVDNHAFIYDVAKKKTSLLPNAPIKDSLGTSEAMDVNNAGVSVGLTNLKLGPRATIWKDGKGIDLNTITNTGYTLLYAKSINDKGQIVVLGQDSHSNGRAFLLTPNGASLASNGTLRVNGTPGPDSVAISVKSGKVRVSVNGNT